MISYGWLAFLMLIAWFFGVAMGVDSNERRRAEIREALEGVILELRNSLTQFQNRRGDR